MEQPSLRPGLVDTDILIDASRGMAQSAAFLSDMSAGGGVTISAISAMELISGCRDATQLDIVKLVISQLTLVPVSESVSARAHALVEAFTLSHRLAIPDALIAATALESDLALYTRNLRHFRMIPGLLIIQPY